MKRILAFLKRKLFWLLLLFPIVLFAQDNSKATKTQKKAEKKKEQKAEQSRRDEAKAKKFQYKIQDKKTRKRMKKHRRQVDQNARY
jgi:hypothetical protein